MNRPLNSAMGQVYPAVAECDRPLRVVYVLTDLCRTSWQSGAIRRRARPGRAAQEEQGVADRDVHPGRGRQGGRERCRSKPPSPRRAVATQGETIEIRGRIRSQGTKPTKRVVEFTVDGKKKDEKTLEIPPNGEVEVNFTAIPRVDDAATCTRARSSSQRRAGPVPRGRRAVLHLQGPAAAESAARLRRHLRGRIRRVRARPQPGRGRDAADAGRESTGRRACGPVQRQSPGLRRPFSCSTSSGSRRRTGTRFNRYVHEGGGLVVAPGHLSQPENYNQPTASQLLPGQLADEPHTAKPPTNMGERRQPDAPAVRAVRQRPGDRACTACRCTSTGRFGPRAMPGWSWCDSPTAHRPCSNEPSRGRRSARSCSGRCRCRAGPITAGH